MAVLPPILAELKATATEFEAKIDAARKSVAGLTESTDQLTASQARASGTSDKLAASSGKLEGAISKVGKAALLGVAAGLVVFGGEAIKLGNQLEDSQASLKAAVTAAGQSMTAWQGPISDTQKKMESLGFTNADVNNSLAKSVISTQDVGKSLGIMGLAADLARAKHIDLTTATTSLDKALTGNLRPLMQMGISLPVVASSALKLQQANDAVTVAQTKVNAIVAAGGKGTAAYQTAVDSLNVAEAKLGQQHAASGQILDALTQRLSGQASAAAQTFSGKIQVLKTQAEDMVAQLGTALIPKIEALTGFLIRNKGAVEDVAKVIAVALGGAIAVFVGGKVVDFVNGVGKMVSALAGLVAKMTGTAAVVATEDDAIIASNEAAGASFTAMLGPIAAVSAAVAALSAGIAFGIYSVLKIAKDSAAQTAAIQTDQNALNSKTSTAAQKTAAAANLYVQASSPDAANPLGAPKSISKYGAPVVLTPAQQAAAAGATNTAANATTSAAKTAATNAALVAAQSQQAAAGATNTAANATTSAAKTAANAATKAAALVVAEHAKAAALLVADGKAGTAALNTQINLTTSTSLTALNTGLNATHNAALTKIEKTLDSTHNKQLMSMVTQLVTVHKQAMANLVAQTAAANAAARLASASGQAGVIGDQQAVANDTAALAGLSSDALAVAQAQLAVDQEKLNDDQQSAALQLKVDQAVGATAKANAQAALDSFNAQAIINQANLAAALSGATNRASLVTSGALPALAAGGLVTRPTIATLGESGPEMVVPLKGLSTAQPSALPGGSVTAVDQATPTPIEISVIVPATFTIDGRQLSVVMSKYQVKTAKATGNVHGRFAGSTQTGVGVAR